MHYYCAKIKDLSELITNFLNITDFVKAYYRKQA